jgi:hypothetical protein
VGGGGAGGRARSEWQTGLRWASGDRKPALVHSVHQTGQGAAFAPRTAAHQPLPRTLRPWYASSMAAAMQCLTTAPTMTGCGWSHTRNTWSWLTRPKPLEVACGQGREQPHTHTHTLTHAGAVLLAWWRSASSAGHCGTPTQCSPRCCCRPASHRARTHLQVVQRLPHVTICSEDDCLQAVGCVGHTLRLAHMQQPVQQLRICELAVPARPGTRAEQQRSATPPPVLSCPVAVRHALQCSAVRCSAVHTPPHNPTCVTLDGIFNYETLPSQPQHKAPMPHMSCQQHVPNDAART